MTKSPQATKDAELVAILQNPATTGREKEKAFNQLYSIHTKQMMLYFNRFTRNSDISEELHAITFQKVYEKLNTYAPDKEAAFSTWMYKVAKNTYIDYLRKRKVEVLSIDGLSEKAKDSDGFGEFQIDAHVQNPEQELITTQELVKIHKAIDSLDNEFIRDVVTYRIIYNLSFEEIAEKMDVPENSTLRVNFQRGCKLLKAKLKA